jgi:hypothetical protein
VNDNQIKVVLKEGRKRQVRRMVEEFLKFDVVSLRRTRIGPINLGALPLGKWRFLSEREGEEMMKLVASTSALREERIKGVEGDAFDAEEAFRKRFDRAPRKRKPGELSRKEYRELQQKRGSGGGKKGGGGGGDGEGNGGEEEEPVVKARYGKPRTGGARRLHDKERKMMAERKKYGYVIE